MFYFHFSLLRQIIIDSLNQNNYKKPRTLLRHGVSVISPWYPHAELKGLGFLTAEITHNISLNYHLMVRTARTKYIFFVVDAERFEPIFP